MFDIGCAWNAQREVHISTALAALCIIHFNFYSAMLKLKVGEGPKSFHVQQNHVLGECILPRIQLEVAGLL